MNNPISSSLFSKALLQRAADKNIRISHLKLQKLSYYCQGYSLAINNTPIFSDKIEAWPHGPVVASIYRSYSVYKDNYIDVPDDRDYVSDLSQQVLDMIDFVLASLGEMGAWALRNKTHTESPWRLHYSEDTNIVDQGEITHKQLHDFFSQHASDMQDKRLASIMDALDESLIEIPENISDKDSFYAWIQSH